MDRFPNRALQTTKLNLISLVFVSDRSSYVTDYQSRILDGQCVYSVHIFKKHNLRVFFKKKKRSSKFVTKRIPNDFFLKLFPPNKFTQAVIMC